MNKKCPKCRLINFAAAENCLRCAYVLTESIEIKQSSVTVKIIKRAAICVLVLIFTITAFYVSLISSAKSLDYSERENVGRALDVLSEKGFSGELFLLNHLTAFRGSDNWLNASVEKENAYAATNFPFEIMTVYPEFFSVPADDTERAAILLHEAQHLKGADEKQAYEFVWKNRRKLGWTKDIYKNSVIWRNVRKQTREYAPNLFVCEGSEYDDCTE